MFGIVEMEEWYLDFFGFRVPVGHAFNFDKVDLVVYQSLDVGYERLENTFESLPNEFSTRFSLRRFLLEHFGVPFQVPAVRLNVVRRVILELSHRKIDIVLFICTAPESCLDRSVELRHSLFESLRLPQMVKLVFPYDTFDFLFKPFIKTQGPGHAAFTRY